MPEGIVDPTQIEDIINTLRQNASAAVNAMQSSREKAQQWLEKQQDLEQELEARGKFSEAEVTEVLTEIIKVLEFVHENDTIHRDIKPSNIMRNQQGVLYLLDFGAVKTIAVGGGNQKRSTGIYSMGFAPPEQMSGSQIYPATDIYALAVTCLNLLTGKPVDELYDSFNNSWQWHQFAPNISDRLRQILDKMLLPTPAQRFQSATEALAALSNPVSPSTKVASPVSSRLSQNNPQPQPPQTPKLNQPTVSTAINTSNPQIPINPGQAPVVKVQNNPPPKPKRKKRRKRPFSLFEVLTSAAFTGFEGALISLGIISWLSLSGESLVTIALVMGGIIFALYRRTIEKIDLVLFSIITAGVVAFIPMFQGGFTPPEILMIATISAAGAIAITAFFRLVYRLLSRLL